MKNLEQFNAETTPPGTPLITRDGREVTEWYHFKTSSFPYPVYAYIENNIERFTTEGKFDRGVKEHRFDLFIKPKVKECWVNVYMGKNMGLYVGDSFNTKQQAIDNKADSNYIKTIRITDEPE